MKKFLYQLIIIINFAVIIPLLLSYLAIYVSPEKAGFISLLGLAYPYLLVLNLIFTFYWMYRKRWAFLYSLAVIALGWTFVSRTIQINFNNEIRIDGQKFSLISYNVRNFDKYNWSGDDDAPDKIARFISDENADIVCLQEFASNNKTKIRHHPQLKKLTKKRNIHVEYAKNSAGRKTAGIITITRFPIINKGTIRFDDSNNITIYSDLKINKDTVRVFNLHLQSVNIDPKEYSMLDSLDFSNREQNMKEAEDILGHLKTAFMIRAAQAEKVAAQIEKSPYPVIVCGDFNDSPVSYAYQKIRGNLQDAFIESGFGLSNTYRGKFPSVRIDYILHSERIFSSDYKRSKIKLSDHYPIECEFAIKQ